MRTKLAAIILVALALAAGLLGFTKPGHVMLYKMGLTTACSTDDCGGN